MEQVIRNIKRIREFRDLTQERVADKLGISQSQYHRIESGDAKITKDIVIKIAEIFDVEPEMLYNFDEGNVFRAETISQSINHNSGQVSFYPIDGKLEKLYEDKITFLEEKIKALEKENASLKKLVQ